MCKHGDTVAMSVLVSLPNRHGTPYWSEIGPIDRCIASIITALNDGGVETVASCCGHGEMDGSIILRDGRWLVVMSDADARAHFKKSPTTIHGDVKQAADVLDGELGET